MSNVGDCVNCSVPGAKGSCLEAAVIDKCPMGFPRSRRVRSGLARARSLLFSQLRRIICVFDSRQLTEKMLVRATGSGQLSFSPHFSLPVMYSSCGALGAYSLLAATGTLRFCHDAKRAPARPSTEAASAASSN